MPKNGLSQWHDGEKWEDVPDELRNKCFTFTFVRHPYDRVLSAFAMFQKPYLQKEGFPQELDSFLDLLNSPKCPPSMYGHTMPMHGIMPIKDNKPDVDFLGRFENLLKDWGVLQKKFGWPDLPSKKSQEHTTNHQLKLTQSQADKVAEYCRRDFEIFGYNPQDFIE